MLIMKEVYLAYPTSISLMMQSAQTNSDKQRELSMETKKGMPTLTPTRSAPKLDKISPTLRRDTNILLGAMGSYRSEDN